jgi:hypothetical protein
MANNTQQRSAKSAEKAALAEEEELRHKVRPGIRAKLADLMAWNGVDVISEAIQLIIINTHALGPEGSAPTLAIPRHDFKINENVARKIELANRKESRKPAEE